MTKEMFTLTTNRAESSHGIPVLTDANGTAYGPADILPSGESARSLVSRLSTGHSRCTLNSAGISVPIELLTVDGADPIELLGPSWSEPIRRFLA